MFKKLFVAAAIAFCSLAVTPALADVGDIYVIETPNAIYTYKETSYGMVLVSIEHKDIFSADV